MAMWLYLLGRCIEARISNPCLFLFSFWDKCVNVINRSWVFIYNFYAERLLRLNINFKSIVKTFRPNDIFFNISAVFCLFSVNVNANAFRVYFFFKYNVYIYFLSLGGYSGIVQNYSKNARFLP